MLGALFGPTTGAKIAQGLGPDRCKPFVGDWVCASPVQERGAACALAQRVPTCVNGALVKVQRTSQAPVPEHTLDAIHMQACQACTFVCGRAAHAISPCTALDWPEPDFDSSGERNDVRHQKRVPVVQCAGTTSSRKKNPHNEEPGVKKSWDVAGKFTPEK